MRNGVQLITYVDRLGGGGLDTLHRVLAEQLAGVFTGAHLLPFYVPFDGADAGFDPTDHTEVDPRLGSWDDVARLARSFDLTADLIVNHVSDESSEFRDFLARGEASPFAGMFLDAETIFGGEPGSDDLTAIYRPRPGPPFTTFRLDDGSERTMWTTFTPHQIDLATSSEAGRHYLRRVLDRLAAAGVAQVRLDAIGYAVKTRGTSSFMTEDTYRFIAELRSEVQARDMAALAEIHSHYRHQLAVASHVDRVYDFALPPLVLHAMYSGSAHALADWLRVSPRNAVTVLDTHDGIGVIDVGPHEGEAGLLVAGQIDELVAGIHDASGGESRLATGAGRSNLDLYQVNCTYYSALGGDDDRYLLARLIQFLSPGIPQVYYAGLLAARNDLELLERTGIGRDINRPYFTRDDIDRELQRPVVRRLLSLIRWRSSLPVFDGTFTVDGAGSKLAMRWEHQGATLEAGIDVTASSFRVRATAADGTVSTIDDWDGF